jgi:gamma-glutamylcysteine synthetase
MSLEQFGWEPIMEGGNVIAMKGATATSALNRRSA